MADACGPASSNSIDIVALSLTTETDGSLTRKMETVCISETLVTEYESTWRHNPEQHRHLHRRENLNLTVYVKIKSPHAG
jgi:hypothetical protein